MKKPRAYLDGVIVSMTGEPAQGATLAVFDNKGKSRGFRKTDASGRFLRINLSAERLTLRLWAPTRTNRPKFVRVVTLVMRPDERREIELAFDLTRFLDPPLESIDGVFAGSIDGVFEMSEFVPDETSVQGPDGEARGVSSVWVSFSRGTMPFERGKTYRVTWRGTLVGPGRYRHLGASDYELRVDEVIEYIMQLS